MAQAHRVTFYRIFNVHNVKEVARRVSSTGERYQNGKGRGAKVSQVRALAQELSIVFLIQPVPRAHSTTRGGKSLNKPAGI